jgi:hypothetical protein
MCGFHELDTIATPAHADHIGRNICSCRSTARRNDESLVLRVAHGNTSALLEGDAERRRKHQIATQSHGSDLLTIAHHGSDELHYSVMLAAVHPQIAVISIGAILSHGERMLRLQRAGPISQERVRSIWNERHGSVAGSPLISISAVSSSPGARR